MDMNIDIKFFPRDQVVNGYLGGGYITSGLLKTNYSVFLSSKVAHGFNISLPSTKGDDGQWTDHCSLTNREAVDYMIAHLQPLLANHLGEGGGTAAPPPSRENISSAPSSMRAPF